MLVVVSNEYGYSLLVNEFAHLVRISYSFSSFVLPYINEFTIEVDGGDSLAIDAGMIAKSMATANAAAFVEGEAFGGGSVLKIEFGPDGPICAYCKYNIANATLASEEGPIEGSGEIMWFLHGKGCSESSSV